jgi:Flp pilus assembly protein TadD
MRTRLVCILAISLSACAAQQSQFRVQRIESSPPAQCESLGEVQGRGNTESVARDVAWNQADGMAGATHIRFTQARIESTASVATQVVTATVYRCPPGVDLK